MKCPICGKGFERGQTYVIADGKRYHPTCWLMEGGTIVEEV